MYLEPIHICSWGATILKKIAIITQVQIEIKMEKQREQT